MKTTHETYAKTMELLSIESTPERESVAAAFLDEGFLLDMLPIFDPKAGCYIVAVNDQDGDNSEHATFLTEPEALRFIDALVFVSQQLTAGPMTYA